MSFIEAMKSNWNKLYALNVHHKTFGERNEEREHKKNILRLVAQTTAMVCATIFL